MQISTWGLVLLVLPVVVVQFGMSVSCTWHKLLDPQLFLPKKTMLFLFLLNLALTPCIHPSPPPPPPTITLHGPVSIALAIYHIAWVRNHCLSHITSRCMGQYLLLQPFVTLHRSVRTASAITTLHRSVSIASDIYYIAQACTHCFSHLLHCTGLYPLFQPLITLHRYVPIAPAIK